MTNVENKQVGGTPAQTQPSQPGIESKMNPLPTQPYEYTGSDKLKGKVAIITGGDSGIGRAVAIAYAKEGANLVINYLEKEQSDAEETKQLVEKEGVQAVLVEGDIGDYETSKKLVKTALDHFQQINIVVNNAAVQYPVDSFLDITVEQWDKTFRTNMDGIFYLCKEAVPHLGQGDSIICTTSVNAYRGHSILIDYTSTKGAIVGFVRSLAQNIADQGIRVNMVAPGPIWTPLIPSTFDAEQVAEFGTETPLKRPGQPSELAGAYVLLASQDGTYITGQCIHVNGGSIMSS
ncbi:SDR family oxidoreductase [Solibacillus isronensis]|uniref:SDR family oxidoreductase n=1 Tax=Solibacillus isronensis TaxID=412383 RepID=UPI00203F2278|nr:SDR family oxidoreductase [Solibacillus isronensis]MCM3722025.1 SDR family oxidoreductase [Solibacillus isronensis]